MVGIVGQNLWKINKNNRLFKRLFLKLLSLKFSERMRTNQLKGMTEHLTYFHITQLACLGSIKDNSDDDHMGNFDVI